MVWSNKPNSFFCMWIYSRPSIIWLKDYSKTLFFSTEWSWPLVNNQLTINLKVYLRTINPIPCYIVMSVSHSWCVQLLLLCSKFWNWEVWLLQFCFYFKIILIIQTFLKFHTNFRIILFSFARKKRQLPF